MEDLYWSTSRSKRDGDNFDAAASKSLSEGIHFKNYSDDASAQKKGSLEPDKPKPAADAQATDESKYAGSRMLDEVIAEYTKAKRLCPTDWSEAFKRLQPER